MTLYLSAYTLVDITNSGIIRVRDNNKKEYHQQQNLNVLLQTIGMRTQAIDPVVHIYHEKSLEFFEFGKVFGRGPSNVWRLDFTIEHEHVWDDGIDEYGFFKQDANGIAITADLDDTAYFKTDVFDTMDDVNIYIVVR